MISAKHHTALRNVGLYLSLSLMLKIAISKEGCAEGILSQQKTLIVYPILFALYSIAALNVYDLWTHEEEGRERTWAEWVRNSFCIGLLVLCCGLAFTGLNDLPSKSCASVEKVVTATVATGTGAGSRER